MSNENQPHQVTGLTVAVDPNQKHIVLLLATRSEGEERGLADQFRCRLDNDLATELVKQLSSALKEIQNPQNSSLH